MSKQPSDAKFILIIMTVLYALSSVGSGLVIGIDRYGGCTYDSVLSRTNLVFALTCELVRPRWRNEH